MLSLVVDIDNNNKMSGYKVIGSKALSEIFTTPQVMLSLVVDIKNNKRRSGRDAGPPAVLPLPLLAWLKTAAVADVCLRNLTWSKLLRPNKKVCTTPQTSYMKSEAPCPMRLLDAP